MIPIVNIVASPVTFNDKFLLIRRIKPPYEGLWSLVGGKIEYGEHIEDAIIREVKEETDLDVKFVAVCGIVVEILYDKNKKVTGHYLMWICETQPKQDTSKEMGEGAIRWFTKEELLENKEKVIPSDFAMVQEFFLKPKRELKIHKSHMLENGKTYELEYFGI
ncbi:MAG: NUDIX domain-containing protein [Candidatus Curtissbacteria bacterium]|nr:NUDIX domain-containing protein [Candidatus Curtissbacteria bacterium]